MNILKMICMAFSTYSRIPMPQVKWEDKNAEYVICFYPLVGLVVGAAEAILLYLFQSKGFPALVFALLALAIPILISGGIHLDGLIDTADARHSYLPKEEKLRILKDPHVGAFGVIRLVLYLILILSGLLLIAEQIPERGWELLTYAVVIPFWSRAVCALTVVWFPKAKKDGMLQAVTGGKQIIQTLLLCVWGVAGIAIFLWQIPIGPEWIRIPVWILADALLVVRYRRMVIKEFGGVSGDLAGWLLCMLELVAVAVLIPHF